MRKGKLKIEKRDEYNIEGSWQGSIEIYQKDHELFGFYNQSLNNKYLVAFNQGGEIR